MQRICIYQHCSTLCVICSNESTQFMGMDIKIQRSSQRVISTPRDLPSWLIMINGILCDLHVTGANLVHAIANNYTPFAAVASNFKQRSQKQNTYQVPWHCMDARIQHCLFLLQSHVQ